MTVETVLAREFPDRAVRSVEPAERGNHKRTLFIDFTDGEEVVVQLADPARLRVETALARAVRDRTDVPTPAVLAEGTVREHGYVVVERAPGTDLHERFAGLAPAERERIAGAFGRWLAAIHDAFAFDGYGTVTLDGDALTAAATDWRAWFREYLAAGLDALPDALADLREPVEAAVGDTEVPKSPPARLFPWDLRPGNALYADEITAILDWGEPLSADPALSAAKVEHLVCDWYVTDPSPVRTAFRDGYRERRPWPEPSRAYRLAAVVRSAVDSTGEVTRPGYPEREGEEAVAFHRDRLRAICSHGL